VEWASSAATGKGTKAGKDGARIAIVSLILIALSQPVLLDSTTKKVTQAA